MYRYDRGTKVKVYKGEWASISTTSRMVMKLSQMYPAYTGSRYNNYRGGYKGYRGYGNYRGYRGGYRKNYGLGQMKQQVRWKEYSVATEAGDMLFAPNNIGSLPMACALTSIPRETSTDAKGSKIYRLGSSIRFRSGRVRLTLRGGMNTQGVARVIIFQWLGKDSMMEKSERTDYTTTGLEDSATWASRVLSTTMVDNDPTTATINNDSGGELRILHDERFEVNGNFQKDSIPSGCHDTVICKDIRFRPAVANRMIDFGTDGPGQYGKGAIGMLIMGARKGSTAGELPPTLPGWNATWTIKYTEAQ